MSRGLARLESGLDYRIDLLKFEECVMRIPLMRIPLN